MSTAWTPGNAIEQSSPSTLDTDPRRSAPPIMQQPIPLVEEEIVWDDTMMDLDDYPEVQPTVQPEQAAEPSKPEIQPVDIGRPARQNSADGVDPSQVRPEAVHIRGVDNLSTDDIRSYATSLFPSFEFKIEWIDDTSLNLAYDTADIATSALQTLSSPHIEELPPTTLRPAKHLTTEKSIDGLKLRIAFIGDKKERGARDRSRWYLFNPHPAEQYERRYKSTSTLSNDRRDSRRRGDRRYDPYPRRQRSRSRSPALNYDESPRNEGVELFPSKLDKLKQNGRSNNRSRSRSPGRRRPSEGSQNSYIKQEINIKQESEDLFPSKIGGMRLAAMMDAPLPTVPHKPLNFGPAVKREETKVELFPEKVPSLEERFGGSGKSLAERIQDDVDSGARELFPELLRGGGGARLRRKKAEDHF